MEKDDDNEKNEKNNNHLIIFLVLVFFKKQKQKVNVEIIACRVVSYYIMFILDRHTTFYFFFRV